MRVMQRSVKGEKAVMNNEKKQTTPKTENTKLGKTVNIIGIVLCVLLLPVLIVNGTLFVQYIIDSDVPPSFLGYTPLVVDTGSMVPEFEAGDLAIVKNKTVQEAEALKIGEVICYRTGKVYITHRIADIEFADSGETMFVTQGDANNTPDTVRVAPSQVLGVYLLHIDDLGYFVMFLQSPMGLLLCVILPLAVLFLSFYLIDKRRMKKLLQAAQTAETPAN